MARKTENPDRGRKLDFENGRPKRADRDEDDEAEEAGDE